MRTRDAMLKDALEARRRYAWLMEAKDMLVVRLAADIPDLLAALAEKGAEIGQLRAALSAAKELFEDACTPDERDSFAWLMQTEELLGR